MFRKIFLLAAFSVTNSSFAKSKCIREDGEPLDLLDRTVALKNLCSASYQVSYLCNDISGPEQKKLGTMTISECSRETFKCAQKSGYRWHETKVSGGDSQKCLDMYR